MSNLKSPVRRRHRKASTDGTATVNVTPTTDVIQALNVHAQLQDQVTALQNRIVTLEHDLAHAQAENLGQQARDQDRIAAALQDAASEHDHVVELTAALAQSTQRHELQEIQHQEALVTVTTNAHRDLDRLTQALTSAELQSNNNSRIVQTAAMLASAVSCAVFLDTSDAAWLWSALVSMLTAGLVYVLKQCKE